METINVIHHMSEFRNILSYATNIGFFFGAGTSCAFGLPTIGKLTDQTKISLSSHEQLLYGKVEVSVKDLSGKSDVTIEDILNHLREIRKLTNERNDYDFKGITGKQASELDNAICNAIFKTIKDHTEKS